MPAPADRYTLTPADIVLLRMSLRNRVLDVGSTDPPIVRYNRTNDAYELVEAGVLLCSSPHLEVVGALLRAERYEPGFIRRILNPRDNPSVALLDADDRERQRTLDAETAAKARYAAQEADERRRAAQFHRPAVAPSDDLSLGDLLNPAFDPTRRQK